MKENGGKGKRCKREKRRGEESLGDKKREERAKEGKRKGNYKKIK